MTLRQALTRLQTTDIAEADRRARDLWKASVLRAVDVFGTVDQVEALKSVAELRELYLTVNRIALKNGVAFDPRKKVA